MVSCCDRVVQGFFGRNITLPRGHGDFISAKPTADARWQHHADLGPRRPTSVLRQIPPPPTDLKSSLVVTITTSGLLGTKATLRVLMEGRLSTCLHRWPRSVLWKEPPVSEVTKIMASLAGWTANVSARPPGLMSG